MIGETYDSGKLEAIRNSDGIWINTQVFREAGNHFVKNGYYCADPWGSPAWYDYWQEERRRCIMGYEVGGAKVTGEHYFYLNFNPIMKVEDMYSTKSKKIEGFPDFWDGDYNYFWSRHLARDGVLDLVISEVKEKILSLDDIEQIPYLVEIFNSLNLEVKIPSHTINKSRHEDEEDKIIHHLKGGYNIIVGKSRRKGYSYKNSAVAVSNFYFKPKSLTILNAYEKKFLYPRGIMTMARNSINFINQNTGWTMPTDEIDKQDHIKASYIQYQDGIKVVRGFESEIMASTCKDNPDVNRGKDAEDVIVEEAGAFGTPGLLKALYKASEDCVKAGAIQTGLITIFGTSGDLESGTADYADMHSRPLAFDLLPFNNIWDKDAEQQNVGFFHPINWNMEGYYDVQGNSDVEGAKKLELEERETLIRNGATSLEIQQRMQEKPLGPAEAFAAISVNNFPVVELKKQIEKVKANNWHIIKGTPVEMSYEGRKVVAKPILDGSVTPIYSYLNVPTNLRGCPVIYEYPVNNPPRGLYKIGYDPIRQEQGTSLAGIIVYKGVHRGSYVKNNIVAEYIGRLESPDDIDRIALMFADLYNTQVMHENEVTGVKTYFTRIKRLDALAAQPDNVINKNIKKSKVARVYGSHMTDGLKDAGERYVKEWLLDIVDYDEDGNPITTIDRIYSLRLLEELVSYYRKGNFDLVSALFMCMFQVQDEELGKEYSEQKQNKNAEQLLEMMNEMYVKN